MLKTETAQWVYTSDGTDGLRRSLGKVSPSITRGLSNLWFARQIPSPRQAPNEGQFYTDLLERKPDTGRGANDRVRYCKPRQHRMQVAPQPTMSTGPRSGIHGAGARARLPEDSRFCHANQYHTGSCRSSICHHASTDHTGCCARPGGKNLIERKGGCLRWGRCGKKSPKATIRSLRLENG